MKMKKKKKEGGWGGGGMRFRGRQTECPQTKTHDARVMPTLPRWLPEEVVLYGTNPESHRAVRRHG